MLDVQVKKQQGRFLLDVAFSIKGKGITALSGPSGSGKTSVVNMVAGLVRPDQGHVRANGRCLFDSDRGVNLAPQDRRLGYVFQDARLFPHLSVRGNLNYGLCRSVKRLSCTGFNEVVDLLGIGHLLDRRPSRLSGGEKQRVAMGRALLSGPDLLLMDEPLASLDRQRKAELVPFIRQLTRHLCIPVLYVSHSEEEIAHLSDRLVMLSEGRVSAVGGPDLLAGNRA